MLIGTEKKLVQNLTQVSHDASHVTIGRKDYRFKKKNKRNRMFLTAVESNGSYVVRRDVAYRARKVCLFLLAHSVNA